MMTRFNPARCCCEPGGDHFQRFTVAGCLHGPPNLMNEMPSRTYIEGAFVEVFADAGLNNLVWSAVTPVRSLYDHTFGTTLQTGRQYWVRVTSVSNRYDVSVIPFTPPGDQPEILPLVPADGFACLYAATRCDEEADDGIPAATTLHYQDDMGADFDLIYNADKNSWIGSGPATFPALARCSNNVADVVVELYADKNHPLVHSYEITHLSFNFCPGAGSGVFISSVPQVSVGGYFKTKQCSPGFKAEFRFSLHVLDIYGVNPGWRWVEGTITE